MLSDADLDVIRLYGKHIAPRMDDLLEQFYAWLREQPEYEEFFADEATLSRVKALQRTYWEEFFSATIDDGYIASRQIVGETHARIGLPVQSYFAGMNISLRIITENLYDGGLTADEHLAATQAITRLVHLDTAVVVQTYAKVVNETIAAQSKTLMEMSTPVTQLWSGILMLPLVGLIDSKRAQDIMNAMLAAITETQARNFILDISGVAVVDTAVANHLIKITKATSLMGCECIISGISPAIAQTIVELGIEVGTVKTTATMKDALGRTFERLNIQLRTVDQRDGPR
jgi:rsbT co-antagonist protein RsbR